MSPRARGVVFFNGLGSTESLARTLAEALRKKLLAAEPTGPDDARERARFESIIVKAEDLVAVVAEFRREFGE